MKLAANQGAAQRFDATPTNPARPAGANPASEVKGQCVIADLGYLRLPSQPK
jgi:hypothetical protein